MTFPEFDNPYWRLLAQVKRPSRYAHLLSQKPSGGKLRFCLAFPDVYEIGMSYYGFQILEPLLNSLPNVEASRAYSPWLDMEELLRAEKIVPEKFDIIGFTLQHELGYTNILTMLDLFGVPLRARERGEDDPLVIAGGVGAMVPGAVMPFFDMFCVGEGEAILPGLCEVLNETKAMPRQKRIEECVKLKGVFSSGAAKISRAILPKMPPIPESLVVPSVPIVHDRAAVEVFRGCARGCRFCQAGFVNRPVRERGAREVIDGVLRLVEETGWEEAGLLSLATCDFTGISDVLSELSRELKNRGVKLSLPSLRMDAFSVSLASTLAGVKRGSLTFAPEAGTQRLRDVINKGITDADIDSALDCAFSNGWDRIKLYFMMGLPTETTEDLDGIVRISERALHIARTHKKKRAVINVSVAGFVPKAHTPFQWERQNSVQELREKGRYVKSRIKSRNITLSYHEPEQTFLEGVFARGDERLADTIETAWRAGARFDNWSETFNLERWLRAFESCGVNPEDYTRERGLDERFSWDFIDTGVSKELLLKERERSRLGCEEGENFGAV